MAKLITIALVLAVGGCDWGSTTPDAEVTPSAGASSTAGASNTAGASGTAGTIYVTPPPADVQVQLAELFPGESALVGVAITPDGKRYVLDQRAGLYEVGEVEARLVFNTTGLSGVELTDVVALDADRFALTAENDGFLLDVRSNSFTSYFCYLPPTPPYEQGLGGSSSSGGSPPLQPGIVPFSISQSLQAEGVQVSQRTESVAFNPTTRQLFAQPRTVRLDTGGIAGAEVFVFGEAGGEPISVLALPDSSFVAAGMAAMPGDRLLLGAGSGIFEVSMNGAFQKLRQLDRTINITGMARAPDGALWILDGSGRRLIEVQGEL
jgi:hypothetical protein